MEFQRPCYIYAYIMLETMQINLPDSFLSNSLFSSFPFFYHFFFLLFCLFFSFQTHFSSFFFLTFVPFYRNSCLIYLHFALFYFLALLFVSFLETSCHIDFNILITNSYSSCIFRQNIYVDHQ